MRAFLLAVQFLTRIPVPVSFAVSDRQLGCSALYYPLIGLLIGGLLFAVAALLGNAPLPLQAALILMLWVAVTGGLHLDGLADCADAWAGGYGNRQRSLEILKDPAAGPVAVTVLIVVLLLKWSALTALLANPAVSILLGPPLLGRTAILYLLCSTAYVRPGGLAQTLTQNLPRRAAAIVATLSLLAGLLLVGPIPAASALLLVWLVRRLALARLGGATGDVYGAAVEVVETVVLTALALA